MKKFLFLILPLAIGFSNSWGEVSVINDQQFYDESGILHIAGEIYNGFDIPINQIHLELTLFSNEIPIETVSVNSLVNTIMPGMKGPFEFVTLKNNVQDYSIQLNYKMSEPKNQVMDIVTSEFERDNFNNLIISGAVANKGEITANTISVVATLYDEKGKVAGVSRTHVSPDYLRADEETFFLISVLENSQGKNIVDYSIVAESEEYAAVPEFPFGTVLLLASSVSAYIGISKYSSKVIANLVSASNLK